MRFLAITILYPVALNSLISSSWRKNNGCLGQLGARDAAAEPQPQPSIAFINRWKTTGSREHYRVHNAPRNANAEPQPDIIISSWRKHRGRLSLKTIAWTSNCAPEIPRAETLPSIWQSSDQRGLGGGTAAEAKAGGKAEKYLTEEYLGDY
ncbi:hypothetical protein CC80DRAFT_543946 [Byssothecium circinans]|uniref:Uncharacterized protein n=1 Tax=Byssothecium circinans TaxID=147558 RepID=A0A6A5U860_9PLEO|nr:hypothetical protein CC80DRAFT_543946 [Byssothecium circinans]